MVVIMARVGMMLMHRRVEFRRSREQTRRQHAQREPSGEEDLERRCWALVHLANDLQKKTTLGAPVKRVVFRKRF